MERKTRILLFCALALCALAPWAGAATIETLPCGSANKTELALDLATMTPDGVTTRPGGRNVTYDCITIANRIPHFNYNVDVAIEEVGIRPLSLAAFGNHSDLGTGASQSAALAAGVSCQDAIKDLTDKLDAVETEKEVSDIGAAARLAAGPDCKGLVWDQFNLLTQTTVTQNVSVKSSQTLTVTLTRPGAKFTGVFPGIARGEWRTSYGFFFLPDRDDRYFVDEVKSDSPGGASMFKIKQDAGREEFDFVPTVVFTFFRNGAAEKAGIGGWTAGLGYDLEKPFVFGGYSWAYNENVIFTGGVAFHRQSRLRGKYHAGDEVSAELEPQQLVEDTYGPNVYVGVSFRFSEDIHAKREALQEATAKADEAAAAARERARKAEEESKLRKAACESQADSDEAAAKVECKGDAVCIAQAEKDAATQKAKCAVTELDRVEAKKAEEEKQDALDKAEKRSACEQRVKAKNDRALLDSSKELDTCKKSAGSDEAKVQECVKADNRRKADAEVERTAENEKCVNPSL